MLGMGIDYYALLHLKLYDWDDLYLPYKDINGINTLITIKEYNN